MASCDCAAAVGRRRLLPYLELQEEEEVGEEESGEGREYGPVEEEEAVQRHPAGLGNQLDESCCLCLVLRDGLRYKLTSLFLPTLVDKSEGPT